MRTIHNSPPVLKSFVVAAGWVVATLWFLFALLMRLTLRVKRVGLQHLDSRPNHILVFWHENLPMYFHTSLRSHGPQVWMQHPALFMTPVHAMLRMMGVKRLAFGSSGNGGKGALEEIIHLLREGYSTVITPDGPRGPVKELKAGALIMAAETGVPIIPVTFEASSQYTMPTWDRKKWPLPFSCVTIHFHPPQYVLDAQDPEQWRLLREALNGRLTEQNLTS
jgi:lysophospholipid acyltransferase (LPLAT)-like uncharacterized protein